MGPKRQRMIEQAPPPVTFYGPHPGSAFMFNPTDSFLLFLFSLWFDSVVCPLIALSSTLWSSSVA
ncbi:hypothetical protein Bca52824_026161 [Brassica carinata]|uniref:Uncharacterized protein n=1 Tax=Brassica carinata TaxID=52824 RepID=A0A8X7SFV9_BRACI|nr:hypothetical protein Bca52824_026161 [Brassica carinata]